MGQQYSWDRSANRIHHPFMVMFTFLCVYIYILKIVIHQWIWGIVFSDKPNGITIFNGAPMDLQNCCCNDVNQWEKTSQRLEVDETEFTITNDLYIMISHYYPTIKINSYLLSQSLGFTRFIGFTRKIVSSLKKIFASGSRSVSRTDPPCHQKKTDRSSLDFSGAL